MRGIRLLLNGIALMVVGIVLTVVIAGELIDNAQPGVDYSTLTADTIKEGMIISGELPFNLGGYETVTREGDNGKQEVGTYYLICTDDYDFWGIYTADKALLSKLERQATQTVTVDDLKDVTPIEFKGKVTAMDDDDKRIIREWTADFFEIDQATLADNVNIMDYYIKVVNTSGHPWILALGILVIVIGAVLILLFVRRKLIGR